MQAEFTNSGSGGRSSRSFGRDFLNSDGSNSEYTLRYNNNICLQLLLVMILNKTSATSLSAVTYLPCLTDGVDLILLEIGNK